MGFVASMIGGVSGVGLHMFANSVQKLPLSRMPWMHVTGFIVGAYVGNAYVQFEESMVKDVNEIRANKGMPPLVGSHKWIRYSEPESK